MSLGKNVFRGILWNHAGRIAEYALMFAFAVVVACGLGPQFNGWYVTFVTLGVCPSNSFPQV